MTKIAVLSDIHGNTTALEAVLADAKAAEVDQYWLLGDILMPGTGRRRILNLLASLPITVRVLGNWENSLWRGLHRKLDPTIASHRYLLRQSQYILEDVSPEEIENLNNQPMQVHRQFGDLMVGITHHLFLDAKLRKDLRAQYMIIEFDEAGLSDVDFRRVDYDVEAELQLAKDLKLPYFQVYYESLVNGIHHTHNHELLGQISEQEGYDQDVELWMERDKKDWF